MNNRDERSNGRSRTHQIYSPNFGIDDYHYYKGGQHQREDWQNVHRGGNSSLYNDVGNNPPSNHARERSSHSNREHHGNVSASTAHPSNNKVNSIRRIWTKHAVRTSLNGIPYIHGSNNPCVRVFWVILLLAATCGMVFHLKLLLTDFFQYEVSSQSIWQNERLRFPAVTFCNVNPIRNSKIHLAKDSLQEMLEWYNPSKQREILKKYNETRDRNTDGKTILIYDDIHEFTEDEDDTTYDDSKDGEAFEDSWENDGVKSGTSVRYDRFLRAYNNETAEVRRLMAHQITDMLISSTFRQRKIVPDNFTMRQSNEYGNCFTLDSDKFIARQSGPREGLDIILTLESWEYLSGLTASKGLQLVIHESKTLAFPSDEGIAINAGVHTQIALRKVKIKRLGDPYEPECVNRPIAYDFRYNRHTCQKVCLQQRLITKCKCYNDLELEIESLIPDNDNLTPCSTGSKCMQSVEDRFDEDIHCDCPDPCSEIMYKKTISSRQWPAQEYASIIRDSFCSDDHIGCDELNKVLPNDLPNEFLKVTIFFEDLNFEQMEEKAQYEMSQFFSDVGGTVGLWIGLSLMGVFEMFHLLVDVIVHLCCTRN